MRLPQLNAAAPYVARFAVGGPFVLQCGCLSYGNNLLG